MSLYNNDPCEKLNLPGAAAKEPQTESLHPQCLFLTAAAKLKGHTVLTKKESSPLPQIPQCGAKGS